MGICASNRSERNEMVGTPSSSAPVTLDDDHQSGEPPPHDVGVAADSSVSSSSTLGPIPEPVVYRTPPVKSKLTRLNFK